MDEALITELETAVADVGGLLVRAQKYRRGAGLEGTALYREALALGDRARRLHRADVVERATTAALLAEARGLEARVRGFVAEVHADPAYRAAVAAHAAGDQATLARLLPDVFAGLEAVPFPAPLFHALAWRRRGRPRAPAELAADAARLAADGIPADDDALAPGVDPSLPAVGLRAEPPDDEPVALRIGGPLGAPVHRLADTDDYLVYVPRLRAPVVAVVRTALAADDTEGVADWTAYRDALADALRAAGLAVELL